MSYLFAATLPLLTNMHTLLVDSPSFDIDYLLRRMVATGLVRENRHPSFCILDGNNNTSSTNILSLLSLQNMRISAPAHMLSLATNRPLTNLDITVILDKGAFASLVSGAENSLLGRTLTTLSLKMAGVLHVALSFPMIASAFVALKHLSMDQTDMDIRVRAVTPLLWYILNALNTYQVVLGLIESMKSMLLDLSILALNRRWPSTVESSEDTAPSRWMERIPLDSRWLDGAVGRIFDSRPLMKVVGITKIVWEMGPYGGVRGSKRLDLSWGSCFDRQFSTRAFSWA